jgi:hypothetical protein
VTARARRPQVIVYDHDEMTPLEAVLVAVRASGCTCAPEVDLGSTRCTVHHDNWCGLLRREDRN